MALTGRTALAAALGALLVGLVLPGWSGLLAVQLPLLTAVLYDLARAAPVRNLRFSRTGDTSVRLGNAADVDLLVTNPGTRPLRAHLRDAWPPSARPDDASRHRFHLPPGESRRLRTTLRPTRRGTRTADRVTVRSYGPLGLAARQGRAATTSPGPSASSPPSPAASTSRRRRPDSANSTAAPAS